MALKDKRLRAAYTKGYRERNKEAIAYHKSNARLRRFGLEPEDLTEMLNNQNFKCKICGEGPLTRNGKTNLSSHLDHCHECNQVRALLCKRCNTLLGFIESDFQKFEKAMLYYVDHTGDCI